MRRIKIFHFFLFLLGVTILCACSGSSSNQLPSGAQAFLNKHFEGIDIASVEQDVNRDYDVYLENGIEINFERKGNWTEIKAKKNRFPESFLQIFPQQLVYYVKTNYPDQFIRKIEKKSYGYRISLSKPNIELSFTRQGIFIKDSSE